MSLVAGDFERSLDEDRRDLIVRAGGDLDRDLLLRAGGCCLT